MITNNYALGFDRRLEIKSAKLQAKIDKRNAKILKKAKLLNDELHKDDRPLDYFDLDHYEETQHPYLEIKYSGSTTNDVTAHIFNFK